MTRREQTIEILKKMPLQVGGLSYIIGTLLLVLYKISGDEDYIPIGICYTAIAIILNILTFIGIIISSFFFRENQNELIGKALMMWLNIPVTILYIALIIIFN